MNIPAWEKCRLDEIGVFRKGAGISKSSVGSGNIACIRYGEIYTDFGPYMKKVFSRISRTIADQSVKLEYGDIVFAGSGETHEEIGKCTAYVLNELVYAGGDTIIFHPKVKCNSLFLGYLLNTPIVNQQKAQMGQGDSIVHISAKSLGKIEVFLPNYEEQTAIATALSDTDALIDSLEKLIAKKQAIKQGTMQELLTGRRRLKGFSGEWKKIILGSPLYTKIDYDNLSFHTPLDYEFDYITLENVKNGVLEKLIHCSYESSPSRARRIVHKNDILFGTVRPNLRSHLYIYDEVQDLICSTGFCVIHTHEEILSSAFVFYKMFSDEIDVQVQAIIAGSNYPAISNSDVHNLEISIPSDIQEQQAIAQILTDMDDEIFALQKKLDKVRRIKQGMMAELLTGRIRLN